MHLISHQWFMFLREPENDEVLIAQMIEFAKNN